MLKNITGFTELARDLRKLKREAPKQMQTFMVRQGEALKRDAKAGTPVDTGTLKNAWHRKGDKKNFRQTVFNVADYAWHVEYGHRTRGKKSFVAGRFMLRKAIEIRRKKYPRELEKLVKEVLKK